MAELAVRGLYPVTIVHGDAETADDAQLIHHWLPQQAHACGRVRSTSGGNDYTTFVFDGEHAQQAAASFMDAARARARSWWVITATAHPVF